MHRLFLAAVITSITCFNGTSQAAIIKETIDISSVIPLIVNDKDVNYTTYVYNNIFDVPQFDAKLGTLNNFTIAIDFTRSINASISRIGFDPFTFDARFTVTGRDRFAFYNPSGDKFIVDSPPRILSKISLPYSQKAFGGNYLYSISNSYNFSAPAPNYDLLVEQGLRLETAYGIFKDDTSPGRELLNLTSTGRGQISFLFDYTPSSVPESATWVLMLFGFGAIGASMRLRKPQIQFI